MSPERRRYAVERTQQQYGMTERHACRLLWQWRGTQRYKPIQRNDEDVLTRDLATKYRRYGYRRITVLLRRAGPHDAGMVGKRTAFPHFRED